MGHAAYAPLGYPIVHGDLIHCRFLWNKEFETDLYEKFAFGVWAQ